MKRLYYYFLFLALTYSSSFAQDMPEGQRLYTQFCGQCHGAQLQGGSAKGFTSGIWNHGNGNQFRNIKHGITQEGMPAFENMLTDEQIRDIVKFIKAEEKKAQPDPLPLPDQLLSLDYEIAVDVFAEGLQIPWAIDFINPNQALITERPGRLRIVKDGKLLPEPVSGTPKVLHSGQGGLLDVAIDPNYAQNGWIYLAYSHNFREANEGERRPPAMTRVVRGHIKDNAWVDEQMLFKAPQETYRTSGSHFGCRIVFDPQGYLYFSIGDRGASKQAQDLSRPNGKIHRIYPDGKIPTDNPFYNTEGAMKTIYSYGHRNPQGLAVHPVTGRVWDTEHGPMGGDEVNLIGKGKNYGWPVITYGLNYNGTIVTDIVRKEGMEQPNYYWKPSIAVCGLDFYRGDLFPKWKNQLLAGGLRYEVVSLLNVESDRIMHEEVIVKNLGRVRDVSTGPDGAIYVVLNSPGTVIRLSPIADRFTK
ncbi:MAG: c-type cytochrome [Candidatus Latescibacteria bacterium]|nr:c-type cytochrome [Candidatus Latescibacterota bacterium]MBT4139514.1 c-type cytochrome [Candidatus Latescibacterota bacterium]